MLILGIGAEFEFQESFRTSIKNEKLSVRRGGEGAAAW